MMRRPSNTRHGPASTHAQIVATAQDALGIDRPGVVALSN